MYKVLLSDSLYSVIETKTNQIINRCRTYQRASRVARSLKAGAGFNGFTPAFIVNNTAPNNIWPVIDYSDERR